GLRDAYYNVQEQTDYCPAVPVPYGPQDIMGPGGINHLTFSTENSNLIQLSIGDQLDGVTPIGQDIADYFLKNFYLPHSTSGLAQDTGSPRSELTLDLGGRSFAVTAPVTFGPVPVYAGNTENVSHVSFGLTN